MPNSRPDNLPLPNLPLSKKLLFSAVLILGLGTFVGSWLAVLYQVYWKHGSGEYLGVALGVLAASDSVAFTTLLLSHTLGMVLILAAAYFLFRMTSLRRRVKFAIFWGAVLFAVLDLSAWQYAPSCSHSNLYVGLISLLAGIPLLALGSIPLWQIWVYPRWRGHRGEIKRVVIVGGGFAGLYAALGLNSRLGYHKNLEITLVDRRNYFLFPPLLPSAAAGTIETRQVSYPFRRIFETTNIAFRKADVTHIDPSKRCVYGLVDQASVMQETAFPYDYLVLAPGSTSQTFGTKGAEQHCFFMIGLNDAVNVRNHVIDCFERAAALTNTETQRELLRFVVVGGGPTGVETATEIYDLIKHVLLKRYPELDPKLPEVCIVQSGEQVLPGWDKKIVEITKQQLARLDVKLLLGDRVSEVGANFIATKTGLKLATRTVIWCAGVKPPAFLQNCGLPLNSTGKVEVESDLRAKGLRDVFVLGDSAHCIDAKSGQPLPPLGQVAFQQGSHTAKNLVNLLRGRSTKPFKYFNFGGLVSVGEHFAAVNLMGVKLSGFIGWFVWRSLYLGKIVGVSNKLRIVLDWTLDLLVERSISQISEPQYTNQHNPSAIKPSVQATA